MCIMNNIYGVLELLGSAARPRQKSRRRRQQFLLQISCHPPGTDGFDTFQFGRSFSKVNDFVFFDRNYYIEKQKTLYRPSKFAFRIHCSSDSLKVRLLNTVINDQNEVVPVKNMRIKRFHEWQWHNVNSDIDLESGTIINTPGATFFWQSAHTLAELSRQLNQLDDAFLLKLANCKFIPDSAFHIDFRGEFYTMDQCFHVISQGTAKFWTTLGIPQSDGSEVAKCPFCEIIIEEYPGFKILNFDELNDTET